MAIIKLTIVNPNVAYRDALRHSIESAKDIAVCSVSPTGKTGLEKLAQNLPSIALVGSGLSDIPAAEFTAKALEQDPHLGIIITVVESDPGAAECSIKALAAGAFDFVLLPALDGKGSAEVLQRRLLPKIRSFMIKRYSHIAQACKPVAGPDDTANRIAAVEVQRQYTVDRATKIAISRKNGPVVVVVGVSTGGPEALLQLIPEFPSDFPLPIVIVLHMPRLFTKAMAESLAKKSKLPVKEAADGDEVEPGKVYLAAGGIHLELERATRGRVLLRTTDGPAENGCKPSVDVLFRSAATVYRDRVIAVVLTGMGSDGTNGSKALKKEGAYVLAQDEASSVVWGMPGTIVREGLADQILPLSALAHHIVNRVKD